MRTLKVFLLIALSVIVKASKQDTILTESIVAAPSVDISVASTGNLAFI